MNEINNPEIKTVYVDVSFQHRLRKDLLPNEEVCEECGGLGLQIDNNPFGLKGSVLKHGFPYQKQSLIPCQHCYSGVRKRCEYCQELLPKGRLTCTCPTAEELRRKKQAEEDTKRWQEARETPFVEAARTYDMLYVADWDEYLTPDELEERLEELEENEPKPQYIYGTTSQSLKLFASDIVEHACEELHEEAYDRVAHRLDELQKLLDEWAKASEEDTKTYYPDFGVRIVL